MKKTIVILLMSLTTVSWADCSAQEALAKLRPGSGYSIEGKKYKTLIWRDPSTKAPSKSEFEKALKSCEDAEAKRMDVKQAREILRAPSSTVPQKVDALIRVLNLDK